MKPFIHRDAITKVLSYIDGHRDEPLDLETLSGIAGISKSHFHRVFHAYMGISLGQYLKLKRLENAMWRLVHTSDKALEIALESGYENHAAFTRAFKQEMGCSPTEFKDRFDQDRKIGLSKLHEKGPEFLGFQERAEIGVFYVRKRGSYFRCAILAWEALLEDLKKNGIPVEKQTYFGIPQDDPNDPDCQAQDGGTRFDLCVESSQEILTINQQLKAKPGQLAGGRFALFLHKGPLERLSDSLHFIYGKWIHDHQIALREGRHFFKYRDPFGVEAPDAEKETEIYLPVQ